MRMTNPEKKSVNPRKQWGLLNRGKLNLYCAGVNVAIRYLLTLLQNK